MASRKKTKTMSKGQAKKYAERNAPAKKATKELRTGPENTTNLFKQKELPLKVEQKPTWKSLSAVAAEKLSNYRKNLEKQMNDEYEETKFALVKKLGMEAGLGHPPLLVEVEYGEELRVRKP